MHSSATPKSAFLELIHTQQVLLGKTDSDVASDLGFQDEKLYLLIKSGAVKAPISLIETLAGSLSLQPADLLRLVLTETMPEVLAAVDALLNVTDLTANEAELIRSYRHLSKGQDVQPVIMDGCNIVALITV